MVLGVWEGVVSSYPYITALFPRIYRVRWAWFSVFFPWSLSLVPSVLAQIYSHVRSALVPILPLPFIVLGSFPLASQSQIEIGHVDFPSPRVGLPSHHCAPCRSRRSRLSNYLKDLLSTLPTAISHLLRFAQSAWAPSGLLTSHSVP